MYYNLVFICVYIQNHHKVANIKQSSLSQIELGITNCSIDLFTQFCKNIFNFPIESDIYFLLLALESDRRRVEHDPD